MTAITEHALQRAIRDQITKIDTEGDECVIVVRSLTIAEVIYAGHDGTFPATCSTGDLPPWAAAGLLAQATAVVHADLVDRFQPGREDDE